MSYLSTIETKRTAELVRDVLERSPHRRDGLPANVREAATASTNELARRVLEDADPKRAAAGRRAGFTVRSAKRIEANRRLLARLAYGSRPPRLTTQSRALVASLLECIEAGAGERCLSVGSDPEPHHAAAITQWASRTDWLAPASEKEWDALLDGDLPLWVGHKVRRFREWAAQRGHPEPRISAAILRFLAPFCGYDRTDGVERAWSDLSKSEQRHAVSAGLALERVWLGQEPAPVRVARRGLKPTRLRRTRRGRERTAIRKAVQESL